MWIALGIAAAILLAAIIYLAVSPGSFEVRRSLETEVSAQTAFDAIVDLRGWPRWNPWLLHEPDARLRFSQNCRQEGGYYEWDGAVVGAGRLTHVRVEPHRRVAQRLDFLRPYKSSSEVDWTLETRDAGTVINWEMAGRMPFLFRFMTRSMAPMIGRDFELGLALLHGCLNDAAAHPTLNFAGEETLEAFNYWAIPVEGSLRRLEAARRKQIEALEAASQGKAGLPLTLYHRLEPLAANYRAEVAIPIADSAPDSNYQQRRFGGGRYFKLMLHGDHRFLPLGWHALFSHCRVHRLKRDQTRPALEIYHDDPARAEHSNALATALYLPIR